MNKVEIGRKGGITVNGVKISKIRNYKIEREPHAAAVVTLEFDADNVDFVEEICEETKNKSLHRKFLGKQLGFLEVLQEEAMTNGNYIVALECSYKILDISREIGTLDNNGKA